MRQKVLTISKRVIAYLTLRGYHYMMLRMRCLTLVACLFPVCFIHCSAAIPVRILSVIRECQCPYDCVRNLDQCLVAGACRICKTPNYGKRGLQAVVKKIQTLLVEQG